MAGTLDAKMVKVLEHRLKEVDEMHTLLQLECGKYKTILAETEGTIQKLQQEGVQKKNAEQNC